MRAEVMFGDRMLLIDCSDAHSRKISELFLDVVFSVEDEMRTLMDGCGVPEQVVLRFTEGDGSLDGMYHVQEDEISEHLIAIDIYTRNLGIPDSPKELRRLKNWIIETFVHELVHNLYESEEKTVHVAEKLAKQVIGTFQKLR